MSKEKAHFVVYSKPHCPQCMGLKMFLKAKNLNFVDCYHGNEAETNELDINSEDEKKRNWSESKRQKFIEEGYQQMPIVRVYNDATDSVIETFTGNNRGEISKLMEEYDFAI